MEDDVDDDPFGGSVNVDGREEAIMNDALTGFVLKGLSLSVWRFNLIVASQLY